MILNELADCQSDWWTEYKANWRIVSSMAIRITTTRAVSIFRLHLWRVNRCLWRSKMWPSLREGNFWKENINIKNNIFLFGYFCHNSACTSASLEPSECNTWIECIKFFACAFVVKVMYWELLGPRRTWLIRRFVSALADSPLRPRSTTRPIWQ